METITYTNDEEFKHQLKELSENHQHDKIKELTVRYTNNYYVILADRRRLYVYKKECTQHSYIVEPSEDVMHLVVWRDDIILVETNKEVRVLELHNDHAEFFSILGAIDTLMMHLCYGNSLFKLSYKSSTTRYHCIAKLNKVIAENDGSIAYMFTHITLTNDNMSIKVVYTRNDEYIIFGRSSKRNDRGCEQNKLLCICRGRPINIIRVASFNDLSFEEFPITQLGENDTHRISFNHKLFKQFKPVQTYEVNFCFIDKVICSYFNGDEMIVLSLNTLDISNVDVYFNETDDFKPISEDIILLNTTDLSICQTEHNTLKYPVARNETYTIGVYCWDKSNIIVRHNETITEFDGSDGMVYVSSSCGELRFVKKCYVSDSVNTTVPLIVVMRFI
jgi:hypothetical protein